VEMVPEDRKQSQRIRVYSTGAESELYPWKKLPPPVAFPLLD